MNPTINVIRKTIRLDYSIALKEIIYNDLVKLDIIQFGYDGPCKCRLTKFILETCNKDIMINIMGDIFNPVGRVSSPMITENIWQNGYK
jgi:hypothetical protein